jgi:hypothetical protein
MKKRSRTALSIKSAQARWGTLSEGALAQLIELTDRYGLSIDSGDLLLLSSRWYVTHAGLLRIARQKQCSGIQVQPAIQFCDAATSRWAFKATVYRSQRCKGFVGYGDADPSMCLPWSTAPRCEWPRPGRSTGPCARPTASASARSRKSARFLNPLRPRASRRSSRPSWSTGTETTADPRSATDSAS